MEGLTGIRDDGAASSGDPDADYALAGLYQQHYSSLVRLAALLVGDPASAEEIVQDSFIALHRARRKTISESAVSYLHHAVVTRSRFAPRQRARARSYPAGHALSTTADPHVMTAPEHQAIISVLRMLPVRQREVAVLRYYTGLSEARIAAAMGIKRAAVKNHSAKAAASLNAALDEGRL
jgi:RNA polymerase sigma factor (sigma-70 family)